MPSHCKKLKNKRLFIGEYKNDDTIWSTYKLNCEDLRRTLNKAESWHRKIKNLPGKKKITMLSLLQLKKDEALDTFQQLKRVSAGFGWPKKSNKKILIEKID